MEPSQHCDMKLKGLLETLEIEFRSILSDSHSFNRKKHPLVKDALEVAVEWIRENKSKEFGKVDEHLTLVIDVFYAVVDAKQAKMYIAMLNSIQRIVMTVPSQAMGTAGFAMSIESRERLLGLFAAITSPDGGGKASSSELDDMVQVKVLQILMMFLDPNQKTLSAKSVNSILQTCFQLHETKVMKSGHSASGSSGSSGSQSQGTFMMLKSTLNACIGQLVGLVTEIFNRRMNEIVGDQLYSQHELKDAESMAKIFKKIKEAQDEIANSQIIAVAEELCLNIATALFIHDQGGDSKQKQTAPTVIGIGMMGTISNQHVWNFKPCLSTKICLLDLLFTFVQQTNSICLYLPKMGRVFENQIIPTLNQMLKNVDANPQFEGAVGIKVIKCICLLVDRFSSAQTSLFTAEDSTQMPDGSSEGDSQSSSRKIRGNNEYRSIYFRDLNCMVIIFAKMAELDQLLSHTQKSKDKEVTTANVAQIFQHLSAKQLVGLEALCLLFENHHVIHQLILNDQIQSLMFGLEVLSRNLNTILLLDLRNSQTMINNTSDDLLSLTSSKPNAAKNVKKHQNLTLWRLIQMNKIIQESANTAAEEEGMKSLLTPGNLQKLTIEAVIGLINTIQSISQMQSVQQENAVQNVQPDSARKTQSASCFQQLGAFAVPVLSLLDKLYLSIQCNYAFDSTPSTQKHLQKPAEPETSYIMSLDSIVFTFEKAQPSVFTVYQKIILGGYLNMINLYGQNSKFLHLRDSFVQSLCDLCVVREIELPRNIQSTPVFHSGREFISQSSMMACVAVIELIRTHFDFRNDVEAMRRERKRKNQSTVVHEQDLQMWQHILEMIMKVDCVLANLNEGTTKKHINKSSEKDIAGVDTTKLINFALIQQKVDQDLNYPNETTKVDISKYVQNHELTTRSNSINGIWCFLEPQLPGQRQIQTLEMSHHKLFKVHDKILMAFKNHEANQLDIAYLRHQLANVFLQSHKCHNLTLFQFCGAYQRLMSEFINNMVRNQNSDDWSASKSMTVQLLQRLVELVFVNIYRLEVIWEQFVQMVNTLLQINTTLAGRNQILIKLAIEANQAVILSYFAYKKNQKQIQATVGRIAKDIKKMVPSKGDIVEPADSCSSSESEEEEGNEAWKRHQWQVTILQPLHLIMKTYSSQSSSQKLLTLRSIEKLIQLQGQNMKSDAWQIIIDIVKHASGISHASQLSAEQTKMEQQVNQNGFKCLKLIINNHLQELGQENIISIFDCIQAFAQADTDNINSNLIAIGMFMNVADMISKRINADSNRESIENLKISEDSLKPQQPMDMVLIWQQMLLKMQPITTEPKAEIRRSLIQIFENIIVNHGGIFPEAVWNFLLKEILIVMMKHGAHMFNSQRSCYVSASEEPSKRKKRAFDDHKVMQQLNDNDVLSWSETCIQYISAIYRTIKKFIQMAREKDFDFKVVDKKWQTYHQILCTLIRHDTDQDDIKFNKTVSTIIIQIYRAFENFLSQDDNETQRFTVQRIDHVLSLITQTQSWVLNEIQNLDRHSQESQQPVTRTKSLIIKMVPEIVTTLYKLFKPAILPELSSQELQAFGSASHLKQLLSFAQSLSDGCAQVGHAYHTQVDKPYKLINEEMQIYKLIEDLNEFCSVSNDSAQSYVTFLFKDATNFKGDQFAEANIRKSLEILSSSVLKGVFSVEQLVDGGVLESIVNGLIEIINSRYQWQVVVQCLLLKGQASIQLVSGYHLINILTFLINPVRFNVLMGKATAFREDKDQPQQQDQHFQRMHLLANQLEILNGVAGDTQKYQGNQKLVNHVWSFILPLIKDKLLLKMEKLVEIVETYQVLKDSNQASLLPEWVYQCQTLDMSIMNMVVCSVLPALNEGDLSELQTSLIQLIDDGCQNYLQDSHDDTELQEFLKYNCSCDDLNLSQFCLFNLFEICKLSSQSQVSQNTVTILISRCRDILTTFSFDEQRSGTIKLQHSRVVEVNMVLKELCNLQKVLEQTEHGNFLIDLMPILSDLITTSRQEIKESLRTIFMVISRQVQDLRAKHD